ncbi:MAG: aldehyde ferredoxin oxidoreductase family protein [Bacillota bacterium]|nr:aldehyde ferredoxin oxidoreductase family protein [Bacillota bacterium]
MIYGYNQKLLRVNLSTGRISVENIPDDVVREYIGGRGFVAKYMFDEIPKGADPLGEGNKVFIAVGPLSAAFLPSSGKIEFGAKSPLTGGYGDSNMGGHLSAELKSAGYDMIIIEGIADKPKYLYIDNDRIEIRDASEYWGMGALDTEEVLKNELGEEFQIATIGPAAEKLLKFACVSHDFGRQAGRTGVGTVLGSKRLKAIAIRGNKDIKVFDPEGLLKKSKEMYDTIFSLPGFTEWAPYGTADITTWVNNVGALPTRNFKHGYFKPADNLTGRDIREKILVKDKGCFCCPIPCGKYSKVEKNGNEYYVEGPEYETIALCGSNLMLENIEDVAYVNYLFDNYGIDTMSGGGVVAFALECCEKGIITPEQVEYKELKFGDLDSIEYLIHKIANRDGIGEILAEGTKKAALVLGKGSERFAIQVKGQECSGYDPRNAAATILAYMTCDVGSHHNRAWAITYDVEVGRFEVKGKAEKVIWMQHVRPMLDTLTVCRFPWIELGFSLDDYPTVLNLVTGFNYTWEDLKRLSERVWNITRAFWAREVEDFGREYDWPPARFYEEPTIGGAVDGMHISRDTLEELLDRYYSLRGWDKNGIPTREKLEELGLSYVAESLGL